MKNRNEINYTVRIAVIIFCLAGLAVITYLVQTNRISAFDDAIYGFFNEHRNPVLTALIDVYKRKGLRCILSQSNI